MQRNIIGSHRIMIEGKIMKEKRLLEEEKKINFGFIKKMTMMTSPERSPIKKISNQQVSRQSTKILANNVSSSGLSSNSSRGGFQFSKKKTKKEKKMG